MGRLHRKKNSKGFTFFELVLVLIILGILAVSVMPDFEDLDDVGYEAVQEATLGALRTAWAVAYSDAGNTDPTYDQLKGLVRGTNGVVCVCTDGSNNSRITCPGVYKVGGSSDDAEFGHSGSTCGSTIAGPNTIVITAS